MKKTLVAAFFSVIAIPALAANYVSSFGFSFNLSSDWLVLTPSEVAKGFSGENLRSLELEVGDQESANAILQGIKGGRVEFFFLRRHSTKNFKNNISAQLIPNGKAPNEAEVQELCKGLPSQLPKMIGAPVIVKKCGAQKANGVSYVAYEYFVPSQAISIVQNEIPYLRGAMLILVAGANPKGLQDVKNAQVSLSTAITAHIRGQQQ